MPVVVEYLLIVKKADSFCDSAEAFTALLNVDASISIDGGTSHFGEDFNCEYAVTSGDIAAKAQRFFHVRFSANDCTTEENLERFSSFLKVVRSIMNRVSGQPETLWDDISFHYARNGYELIYRVENLMRKLIANFMLVTVGAEWVDESTPKVVKEVIDKSKRKEYLNVLHQIDFIHLADVLLRPYSTASNEEIQGLVKRAESLEDLTEIKRLVPQSNWSRYFSALVDCDDSYLKKRWEELYDLRCKVAHNAIVNKADFERIAKLVTELEGKLDDAIRKLPQVQVPQAEVEQVAENAASSLSELTGEFISVWRSLEGHVTNRAAEQGLVMRSFSRAIEHLHQRGAISPTFVQKAIRLNKLKNHIVHPTGNTPTSEDLGIAISTIRDLVEVLSQSDQSGAESDRQPDE